MSMNYIEIEKIVLNKGEGKGGIIDIIWIVYIFFVYFN